MKRIVRNIDRALKRLYALESTHQAERFLILNPLESSARVGAGRAESRLDGALYVEGTPDTELGLGIFLSEGVRETLRSFLRWEKGNWTHRQVSAFCVAVEEISHFNYLIHHGEQGRPVSRLELELQAEIDKFVITLFAEGREVTSDNFQRLFEKCFHQFHLNEALNAEEKERYSHAIQCAKLRLQNWEPLFVGRPNEAAIKTLRHFYRLSREEKTRLSL